MIFADSNGELDVDAPNAKGWADTIAFIEGLENAPALKELADKGHTENLAGLLKELNGYQSEDADVQDVLSAIEEAALEAEDILIVSE